jgi:hypothetical protein
MFYCQVDQYLWPKKCGEYLGDNVEQAKVFRKSLEEDSYPPIYCESMAQHSLFLQSHAWSKKNHTS